MKCPKCKSEERTKMDLAKISKDINVKIVAATIFKDVGVAMLQR